MKTLKLSSALLFLWDILKLVILAFIIVWPIHHFIFQPFLVQGPSMEPNFFDREYLIIEEISYRFTGGPQRGEVVVFKSPSDPKDYLIKRVIGLPGERTVIKDGQITIYNNDYPMGVKLTEKYLYPGLSTGGDVDVQLTSGQYYVLGDNRTISLDSRSFGPIKRSGIVGRAWLRGWPLNRLTRFTAPVYQYQG